MKYINLDYLKQMTYGDKDMELTMLDMLIAEIPDEFDKMKKLYEDLDWEELGQVSHKMKSTLAFVGNDELTEANKEIEQLAKNNPDTTRLTTLFEVMDHMIPFIMDELKSQTLQR